MAQLSTRIGNFVACAQGSARWSRLIPECREAGNWGLHTWARRCTFATMWTRLDIVNTPDSIQVQFGPGVGRHVLAWLVMVGAGLSVYGVLDQGEVGPASLVISAVVILLGAVMRMGLRARSTVDLTDSGLSLVRRGVPEQSVPLNHLESFVVARTGAREGVPGSHLRIHTRGSSDDTIRVGAGVSKVGLQGLADLLTLRVDQLRSA